MARTYRVSVSLYWIVNRLVITRIFFIYLILVPSKIGLTEFKDPIYSYGGNAQSTNLITTVPRSNSKIVRILIKKHFVNLKKKHVRMIKLVYQSVPQYLFNVIKKIFKILISHVFCICKRKMTRGKAKTKRGFLASVYFFTDTMNARIFFAGQDACICFWKLAYFPATDGHQEAVSD